MNDHEAERSRNRRWRRIVVALAVALVAPFFLTEPFAYLVSPSDSLYVEAGWKSYREDRSRRIKFLLWYGADPNKIVDERRNYAAIHTAVHWGAVSSLRQLIDAGADVNLESGHERKRMPLDIGCWYGGAEVIEVLLQSSAKRLGSYPTNSDGVENPTECYD